VLHQELNIASRTGQSPNDQEPCNIVARSSLLQQSPANSAENNRWTNKVDSGEESNSDKDVYNDLVIPSYIIHKAADLAQCHARLLQDFEEIFAQEGEYMRYREQPAKDIIPAQGGSMSILTLPCSYTDKPAPNKHTDIRLGAQGAARHCQ
jgi:hypothetical protein